MSVWRTAAASAVGSSHASEDRGCEDASAVRRLNTSSGEVLILAASDGAGSSARAAEGSRRAVDAFCEIVGEDLASHSDGGLNEARMRLWLDGVREQMMLLADRANAPLRDFAATLLAVVLTEEAAAFVQLGDGAIVFPGDEGAWTWMFEPHKGEYANETSFITDETAIANASVAVLAPSPDEIAIFTDGLERLLIQEGPDRAVVGAFFEQMMPPVRLLAGPSSPDLDASLSGYLSSDVINSRTDDDRTLILASRVLTKIQALGKEHEQCATL